MRAAETLRELERAIRGRVSPEASSNSAAAPAAARCARIIVARATSRALPEAKWPPRSLGSATPGSLLCGVGYGGSLRYYSDATRSASREFWQVLRTREEEKELRGGGYIRVTCRLQLSGKFGSGAGGAPIFGGKIHEGGLMLLGESCFAISAVSWMREGAARTELLGLGCQNMSVYFQKICFSCEKSII